MKGGDILKAEEKEAGRCVWWSKQKKGGGRGEGSERKDKMYKMTFLVISTRKTSDLIVYIIVYVFYGLLYSLSAESCTTLQCDILVSQPLYNVKHHTIHEG